MPQDVWTPMITSDHSLRNKSKVAHVERLRGLMLRYAVTVINRNQQRTKKKISCPPEKKSKAQNNDDVRKVVIYDKMHEEKKNFCPPKKKAKNKKITTTFGKSLFLIKCKKQKRISVLREKRAKPKQK